MAGTHQQGVFSDLRLQAAERTAAAGGAIGIHRHVADLAGVSVHAEKQSAVNDHAAAHSHLPRETDDVVRQCGCASPKFGHSSQIRPIGDDERHCCAKGFGQHFAQWNVSPAEVRGEMDPAVAAADDPIDADADSNESLSSARPFQEAFDHFEQIGNRMVDGGSSARSVQPNRAKNAATQADYGHGHRIDGDLDAEYDRA